MGVAGLSRDGEGGSWSHGESPLCESLTGHVSLRYPATGSYVALVPWSLAGT